MIINRKNYEQYVLDYLEGRLDHNVMLLMKHFLLENPDIEEEIETKPISEHILTEENDLVLIENNEIEKESENPFILKTEEVISEQKGYQDKSDDMKANETIVTKLERANDDRRFSSGTVKWEFGFS